MNEAPQLMGLECSNCHKLKQAAVWVVSDPRLKAYVCMGCRKELKMSFNKWHRVA